MKPTFLCGLLFCTSFAIGQSSEFAVSKNGLIYPDYTVIQLKQIVDSLNLKFRRCDLHTTYYSLPQARASFVQMKGNCQAALADMKANITIEAFEKKYSNVAVTKEKLLVKFRFKNYEQRDVTHFSTIELGDASSRTIRVEKNDELYNKPLKNKWVFQHSKKTSYSEESLEAFYILEDFIEQPLKEEYARIVQYTDCMVDTTTGIYLQETFGRRANQESAKLAAFHRYVNELVPKPDFGNDYSDYSRKMAIWDSLRFKKIDEKIACDNTFMRLLNDALAEAKMGGGSHDEFEQYISHYISPKTALDLKRSRKVIGQCSQDDSPRMHALSIAKLSAEAISWEVFLRAHLDIMNDRFERVTDGSYAWAARQTYIKELEVLDINVLDLLLGINLRISNPSQNHYFGSVGRTGRALAESKDPDVLEARLLRMIKDDQLDPYNRVLMYWLFNSYNHHLQDNARKARNAEELKNALKTLPAYLTASTNEPKSEGKK